MNSDLAAQRALDKLNRSGFDALTVSEKALATVWLFEARVANGGFHHYYASPAGNLAYYAPTALSEIGATELAAIAESANLVFGPAGPPKDRVARKASIDHGGEGAQAEWRALESRFFDCEEDVDELLEAYLDRSRELVG